MKKKIIEHQPQITIKSYGTEVNNCQCGVKIKAEDKASWKEWAEHIEAIK